ncbi:MAG: helix-turn-helix transcriptional regulator [Neomegalonema sp.]|nr:helix-turn-helix transcriptional regulator [Neomegalonema sp.]
MDIEEPGALYLTTKEVATLLRVKERKVYDLVAAGDIPHRRITGKLLFIRQEILNWVDGVTTPNQTRPAVLCGSHDPLLDWAARESGSDLATLFNGSADGLDRFADGEAAAAGLHVPDAEGWNLQTVAARGLSNCVLISWAVRSRGFILTPSLEQGVAALTDLRGKRVVQRQPGAGAAALFEQLRDEAGLSASDFLASPMIARTESEAAAAVAAGEADAALGVAAMAKQFNLPFAPLMEEQYDLLIERRAYFTAPVQTLLNFTRTQQFREKAATMGGYNLSAAGAVRWLSP